MCVFKNTTIKIKRKFSYICLVYITHTVAVVVLVITVITVRSRKRIKDNHQDRLINQDSGDRWDEKRHFKYDVKKAEDDYTNKHLKENNIDEEFAKGAVVNPLFAPEGVVMENPTYLVRKLAPYIALAILKCMYTHILQSPN